MLIKLASGKVYDPANRVSGQVRDIYVEDGKIVAAKPSARIDATYDLKGKIVMAGAIDPHTHIGGGKMTIARMLLPEDHLKDEVARTDLTRSASPADPIVSPSLRKMACSPSALTSRTRSR